jgi:hypothetical protein
MNTGEICCILERFFADFPACKFLGVFAANEVPTCLPTFPCCFIVNTDPNNKPGEHWIACYCESAYLLEFFDSYGLSPVLYQSIRLPTMNVWYNPRCFQSMSSNACGYYSIYYVCCRARGVSKIQIQSHLRQWFSADNFVSREVGILVSRLGIAQRCNRECRGQKCCKMENVSVSH